MLSDVHARSGEPQFRLLAVPRAGPLIALGLLLLPAGVAVLAAILVASLAEPVIDVAVASAVSVLGDLPPLVGEILVGDYGLVTMGPLLLVWTLPTATAFSLLQGAMNASGLLDRLTWVVHPLLRHVGLNGRDLVRVLMGFGCNVPAVVATRSCSTCTRDTTIHAIAFGSACSYQLGATLAVFAAIGRPGLVVPYLAILAITTLLYTPLGVGPRGTLRAGSGGPSRSCVPRGPAAPRGVARRRHDDRSLPPPGHARVPGDRAAGIAGQRPGTA